MQSDMLGCDPEAVLKSLGDWETLQQAWWISRSRFMDEKTKEVVFGAKKIQRAANLQLHTFKYVWSEENQDKTHGWRGLRAVSRVTAGALALLEALWKTWLLSWCYLPIWSPRNCCHLTGLLTHCGSRKLAGLEFMGFLWLKTKLMIFAHVKDQKAPGDLYALMKSAAGQPSRNNRGPNELSKATRTHHNIPREETESTPKVASRTLTYSQHAQEQQLTTTEKKQRTINPQGQETPQNLNTSKTQEVATLYKDLKNTEDFGERVCEGLSCGRPIAAWLIKGIAAWRSFQTVGLVCSKRKAISFDFKRRTSSFFLK